MPAGAHDFTVEQGATFKRTLTWLDDANLPVNVTGYSAKLQIRQTKTPASAVLVELTNVNGGIVLGGVLGTVQLVMTSAATAALAWTRPPYYDLKLTSGSGEVTRLLQGRFKLSKQVTV